jgi:hypothetical protein
VAEGLSATAVGKEISEHAEARHRTAGLSRHDRLVSIAEAVLLSIVTIVAAWSGYGGSGAVDLRGDRDLATTSAAIEPRENLCFARVGKRVTRFAGTHVGEAHVLFGGDWPEFGIHPVRAMPKHGNRGRLQRR